MQSFSICRYQCEGRSAGALQGLSSGGTAGTGTPDNRSFPAIRINNYVGPAACVVSLVEEHPPYRAHPHNLVGKDGTEFICRDFRVFPPNCSNSRLFLSKTTTA